MSPLTYIFLLPLLAAIALAFVPRNFAVIMRAVAVGMTKPAGDKRQPKRLPICSAPALDSSTPCGHAERPLAGLFSLLPTEPPVKRAAVDTKLVVDNCRMTRFLIPQFVGASFIYSPPHTPKGLGRGYFFPQRRRV